MSGRHFTFDGPQRSSFRIDDGDGRRVAWSREGRRWLLHGHRLGGDPVVDLQLDGITLATISVVELKDLRRALDLLVSKTLPEEPELGPALPAKAGSPWNPSLDQELGSRWQTGESIAQLTRHFGRSNGAIVARVVKLGLAPDRASARLGPQGDQREPLESAADLTEGLADPELDGKE